MKLPLYLSKPDSANLNHIKRGSAILGPPEALAHEYRQDEVTLYYEGGNQSTNVVTYADRAMQAAYRLLSIYPTVALASAPERELTEIGYFDLELGQVTIFDEATKDLAAWLDTPELNPAELLTSQDASSRRREYREALKNPAHFANHQLIRSELKRLDKAYQDTIERVMQERQARQVSQRIR